MAVCPSQRRRLGWQHLTSSLSLQPFRSGNGLGVVADFNGDGHLDQAVLSSNGVSIFLGNGDGTFTLKSTITLGSQPYSLAVGDFNGDDHPDLAVADVADSTVIVLLGNGDGSFTSETAYTHGPIPGAGRGGRF